ncbi:MAG TPA: MFS transporter [Gaiellales bacterium]
MSAAATQTSNTLDDGTGRLSKRAWGALLVLCGALFLDALDVSMVGVALPSIKTDLGLSTSSLQWAVSAYVLGYGGFLLLGGRAADLLGRRKVFLISLGVFVVASLLGGFAHDGNLLIATRFIKGMSAAFTAPAGLSIITTSFAEGKARNKALSVYTATGATGFSLGLVIGGALTEAGWRWVFFLPAPVALAVLIAGYKLVPTQEKLERKRGGFDVAGAVSITGAMLLLVYTLVSAPTEGWTSARTLTSFAAAAALLVAFIVREQSTETPLVRLGILKSGSLVRANLGAMTLFGSWVGFQFIATLYLQQLRDWSALETGLAIFPGGVIVAVISTRMVPLVMRFGITKLIVTGFVSLIAAYTLFLPIGLNSSYAAGMLPTVLLAGLGFALAFGPLTIAASSGVEAHEQGLAGGLLNTSFQFGGALMLAVTTAVINANTGASGTPQAILDGFHPGLYVPLGASVLGIVAVGSGLVFRRQAVTAPEAELEPQMELELEAA